MGDSMKVTMMDQRTDVRKVLRVISAIAAISALIGVVHNLSAAVVMSSLRNSHQSRNAVKAAFPVYRTGRCKNFATLRILVVLGRKP